MIKQEHKSLIYYSFEIFEQFSPMSSVISTRLGGVSEGPFHSLNLALSVGDNQSAVITNRSRLYEAVGVESETVAVAQLIQGTHIEIVTDHSQGNAAQAFVGTDGLVTNVQNRPHMILVADCAAVTLFDPKRSIIALAHGGWRGTVGKIMQKMVSTMNATFGCDPADILVGIGPSIGPCCYQVREDVIDTFHATFPQQAHHFFVPQEDDTVHLDMWTALRW